MESKCIKCRYCQIIITAEWSKIICTFSNIKFALTYKNENKVIECNRFEPEIKNKNESK
jgi:hypothetical protein